MITIHDFIEQRIAEGMDPHSAELINEVFTKFPNVDTGTWYRRRNKALLALLGKQRFARVFEVAGGSGLFASMFMKEHPETKLYVHSDFSRVACELARERLKPYPVTAEMVLDMRGDIDPVQWGRYNLIVSTALEHLPAGVDLSILSRVKKGRHVLLSLATFAGATHPNPYPTREYIEERFSPLIDINTLQSFCPVWLLHGVKRSLSQWN